MSVPVLAAAARGRTGRLLLVLGVAAASAFAERAQGGYFVDVWGPLGLGLVALAAVLVVAAGPPARWTAFAALALGMLAVWVACSPLWGGLPNDAWALANECVIGAAALLAGSVLGRTENRADLVLLGLVLGALAQAAEVLVRLAADGGPARWTVARALEGPVGYTNAQALVFVTAVPLAIRFSDAERPLRRGFAAFAAVGLLAATFLTQSRGALLALAIAVGVQLVWARSLRCLVSVFALSVSAAVLVVALRTVDSALLDGSHAEAVRSLRLYLLWTILLGAGAAALAFVRLERLPFARRLGPVVVVLLLVGSAAAALAERGSLSRIQTAAETTNPVTAPGGSTRLLSLSLSGRRQTWRVAWETALDRPLHGDGAGQFTRDWARERGESKLYVRQPHSILLELAAEVGFVGLAFFIAFAILAFVSLVRPARSRQLVAAAGACLTAFLVDASVDFTWSFVSLLGVVLLAVGAAAGAPARRRSDWPTRAAIGLVAAGLVVSIGTPYAAHRRLTEARALAASDPRVAYEEARSATSLNPWDPNAYALEGQLAEAGADYRLAADRYSRAADLARMPWVARASQARALLEAGDQAGSLRACLAAALSDPGEPRLQEGSCAFDLDGNRRWPVERVAPTGSPERSSNEFAAYFRDAGCDTCLVELDGPWLEVGIHGTHFRDTAYGQALLGEATGWAGPIYVRAVVGIEADSLDGDLSLLQLRGRYGSVEYELYVSSDDGTIHVFSPAGTMDAAEIDETTGVRPSLDGRPLRIDVMSIVGRELMVRVDGETRVRRSGLDGAETDRARELRAGALSYSSDDPRGDAVRVRLAGVAARQGDWLGPLAG